MDSSIAKNPNLQKNTRHSESVGISCIPHKWHGIELRDLQSSKENLPENSVIVPLWLLFRNFDKNAFKFFFSVYLD